LIINGRPAPSISANASPLQAESDDTQEKAPI
jgi:hypothetical protein